MEQSQSKARNFGPEPDLTVDQNGHERAEANRLAVDSRNGQVTLESQKTVENPDQGGVATTTAPKPPAPHRRIGLLLGGTIALIIGSMFGWRWWQFQQTHISTDNAQIQGHPSPIAAKITATVKRILVKNGDYVQVGQPIVILEDADLVLKVQQAEAQLAIAKAQLQSAVDTMPLTQQTNTTQVQQSQAKLVSNQSTVSAAEADVTQAQAAIDTNQAKVAQAQTALNKAQADFHRYETLFQQGAIAAQQFDAARAAQEDAQANLTVAHRMVDQSQAALQNAQANRQKSLADTAAAQGQLAETQASGQTVVIQQDQQKLAQAQVQQAAATLALARQQLAYTTIKAPVSGSVGELTAQVGQQIQAEQPLLSLVPLQNDQIYVEANFKETATGHLQIGQPAEIKVDAYPGETFHATIAGISPATGAQFALIPPDNATGNFNKVVQWVPIRLTFDPNTNLQPNLRPGLSVSVVVNTQK